MSWDIVVSNNFKKSFSKLNKDLQKKVYDILKSLRKDPFLLPYKKLKGTRNYYRVRIGKYRLVYSLDHEKKVIKILDLDVRGRVYKNL
jgi:mRNA interferase RelE/StbE